MRNRKRRGNAFVEMAFTLLPLFAIMFGIVDFGFAIFLRSTFQHAVREGARYAVTYQLVPGMQHDASIKNVVFRRISTHGPPGCSRRQTDVADAGMNTGAKAGEDGPARQAREPGTGGLHSYSQEPLRDAMILRRAALPKLMRSLEDSLYPGQASAGVPTRQAGAPAPPGMDKCTRKNEGSRGTKREAGQECLRHAGLPTLPGVARNIFGPSCLMALFTRAGRGAASCG